MKARFMMENPDQIEATMKITMTLAEWTDLRDQLSRDWPSWRLSSFITDLVGQSRKVFYPEVQEGEIK